MKTREERNIGFITWMQVIGCFLVILGHSYPFVVAVPVWANRFKEFIYAFHMPLFVWCSGYLLVATKQTQRYGFLTYMARRAKHILIPYFAFSLLGILPKVLLSSALNDSLSLDAMSIVRAFLVPRDSIWGHFWFLPMIFFLGLLGYGVEKGSLRWYSYGVAIVAGVAGVFAPEITDWFGLNDVLHFLLYMVLGMACAKVKTFPLKSWGSVLLAAGSALFLLTDNDAVIQLLVALCMVAGLWSLTESFCVTIPRKAVWAQTYPIFVLSWPCQLVVEVILERILVQPFAIVFPCMLIAGITGPIVILLCVDWFEKKTKTRFISTMIGR